jgi:membrane protein DedA with SNARE-associated domain
MAGGLVFVARGGPANEYDLAPEIFLGAAAGSIAGMVIGARWASRQSGNIGLTTAAAIGGTAIGLTAGYLLGTRLNSPVLLIALPIATPLLSTSFAEWRSH